MPLRSYDPALARWNRIDPVTHHSLSPYNSFDNNPVFYADPSGGNSWGSGDVVVGSDHNSGASNWAGGWTDYSEWGVSTVNHYGGADFWAADQQFRDNISFYQDNNANEKSKSKWIAIAGDLVTVDWGGFDEGASTSTSNQFYIRDEDDTTGIPKNMYGHVFRIFGITKESAAYDYMSKTSYNNTKGGFIEIAAWLAENVIIVLPYHNNNRTGSYVKDPNHFDWSQMGFKIFSLGSRNYVEYRDTKGKRSNGGRLLGIVHTHPDHSEFSMADKSYSKEYKVPYYIIRGSNTNAWFNQKGYRGAKGVPLQNHYEIRNHATQLLQTYGLY